MEDFRDLVLPPANTPSSANTQIQGGASRLRSAWEPALNDMLADPITQLLMRRDGVKEGEVRRLVERLRRSQRRA